MDNWVVLNTESGMRLEAKDDCKIKLFNGETEWVDKIRLKTKLADGDTVISLMLSNRSSIDWQHHYVGCICNS